MGAMVLHHRAFLRLRHHLAIHQNQSAALPFRQLQIHLQNFPFLQKLIAQIVRLRLAVFPSVHQDHPQLLALHCLQRCQGLRPVHLPYRALQSNHARDARKPVDHAVHLQGRLSLARLFYQPNLARDRRMEQLTAVV